MPERDTTRRDFLHGKSAAEALSGVGERWLSDPEEQRTGGDEAATLTLSRRAMACDFQIRLPVSPAENAIGDALEALDLIEAIEDRLTVYREDSEVIDLNRHAFEEPVEVEPDVFGLLELAGRLHRDTGGALDVTAGPLSDVWGFTKRQGRLPSRDEIAEAMQRVGWADVLLNGEDRTVRFLRPGLSINFNSSGKGFALDEAGRLLLGSGVDDFLIHGGRSTLLARGAAPGGGPWAAGVRHPLRPQQRVAECALHNAALSTSGSRTQCFVHEGRRYGHLIDPRTGWPAEGLHSVTVVAATGAEADSLSTALYVLGADAGERYCVNRPDVQALFVVPKGRGDAVELRGVNLSPDCWRLAKG